MYCRHQSNNLYLQFTPYSLGIAAVIIVLPLCLNWVAAIYLPPPKVDVVAAYTATVYVAVGDKRLTASMCLSRASATLVSMP